MANNSISQIQVGNTTYDICDPTARDSISSLNSYINDSKIRRVGCYAVDVNINQTGVYFKGAYSEPVNLNSSDFVFLWGRWIFAEPANNDKTTFVGRTLILSSLDLDTNVETLNSGTRRYAYTPWWLQVSTFGLWTNLSGQYQFSIQGQSDHTYYNGARTTNLDGLVFPT